jgi:hypothetical protein
MHPLSTAPGRTFPPTNAGQYRRARSDASVRRLVDREDYRARGLRYTILYARCGDDALLAEAFADLPNRALVMQVLVADGVFENGATWIAGHPEWLDACRCVGRGEIPSYPTRTMCEDAVTHLFARQVPFDIDIGRDDPSLGLDARRGLAVALARSPHANEADLLSALALGPRVWFAEALIAHPAMGSIAWPALLQQVGLSFASRSRFARADAGKRAVMVQQAIRDLERQGGESEVLARLLPYVTDDEFRRLVHTIATYAPEFLGMLVARARRRQWHCLTSDEVIVMLASQDSALRLRAQILLGERTHPVASPSAAHRVVRHL